MDTNAIHKHMVCLDRVLRKERVESAPDPGLDSDLYPSLKEAALKKKKQIKDSFRDIASRQ